MKFTVEKLAIAMFSSMITAGIFSKLKKCPDEFECLENELDNLPQRSHSSHLKMIKDQSDIKWCHGYLRFLDPPGPLTALASYPGSGNTWLRYLLQQATGIVTGSVYNSKPLRESTFPAEGIFNRSVIAIKTHIGRKNPPNPKWPSKFDKVILLVRDPFEALLAEFNRQQSKNQTGYASDEKFETEWPAFITKSVDFWRGFHIYFKNEYQPHQIMFTTYESLQRDVKRELREILHFLGVSLPDDVANCVQERQEGVFHREKPIVDQMKYYNAEQRVVLNAVKEEIFAKLGLKL